MKKDAYLSRILFLGLSFFSLWNRTDTVLAYLEQTNDSLYLYIEDTVAACYQVVIDSYRERYPQVDLRIETYPMSEYTNARKKMNTELLAGEGPDLLLLGAYDNEDVYKLMKAGVFAPLDAFLEQDDTYHPSDYAEEIMSGGVLEGHQYMIPLSYSVPFALSSMECLEELGFDLSSCDTFEGFFEQVTELYESERKDRVLVSSGGLDCFPELMGVPLLDYENQTVLIDTPEMKWAIEQYKKMYEEDHSMGYDMAGFAEAGTAILERNAYLYVLGNPAVAMQAASGIAARETPVIIPIRTLDGKTSAVINHSAAVRANSPNQANAWNFIRMLLEIQEDGIVLGGTYSYLPVNKKGLQAVILNAAESVSDRLSTYFESGMAEKLPVEFLDDFTEILAQPEHTYFFRKITLGDFVNGKMLPYFEEKASYEACMEDYVNYAMIYVSE